ncbi:MAG: PDZ domain-containing protein [Planctomycetaceae bacterium]
MSFRRRSMIWTLVALCVPFMVQAEETDSKPATVPSGALQITLQERDPEPLSRAGVIVSNDDAAPSAIRVTVDQQIQQKPAEADAQGKCWLGLICSVPSDTLRSQLDLPSEVGLVVDEVYEDGPAKKAGLLTHDVLISTTIVGKDDVQTLKTVMDLVNAVKSAETSAIKVEFLRRGKKQTLEVIPAERPVEPRNARVDVDVKAWLARPKDAATFRWAGPLVVYVKDVQLPDGMTIEFQPADGEPKAVIVKRKDQVWAADVNSLDKLPEEIAPLVKQQLQARIAHAAPKVTARTSVGSTGLVYATIGSLPEDVTVTTVRKGTAPVKVSVQKGNQTWEVSEKELAKLPAEIRHYVEMALSGPTPFTRVVAMPAAPVIPPKYAAELHQSKGFFQAVVAPVPSAKEVDRPSQSQAEMERQLKELSEQVEKLRQAVEKSLPKQ